MSSDLCRALRDAAEAPLPPGAFLRRDRGDALFVTDAARRDPGTDWPERFSRAGFVCRGREQLIFLTPAHTWIARLEDEYPDPPDHFCATLSRFRGLEADGESLTLFALGAKALDGGESLERYDRLLRQRAAVCLRAKDGGGGLYGCAVVRYLINCRGDPMWSPADREKRCRDTGDHAGSPLQ